MFDSPCPRNSRFASMRWPERWATVLAIEIACPSATMVSANASPSKSAACAQVMLGHRKSGHGVTTLPMERSAGKSVKRAKLQGSAVAAASPISMYGSLR